MNDVQIPEAYGPGNHRPTAKKTQPLAVQSTVVDKSARGGYCTIL